MSVRDFSLLIVGLDYANRDGSNRRFAALTCQPGDPLILKLEPRNRADPHAVAVLNARGEQIGYLPAERAPWIGSKMRDGLAVSAIFQEMTAHGAALRLRIGEGVPLLPPPSAGRAAPVSDPDAWDAVDPDGGEWGA